MWFCGLTGACGFFKLNVVKGASSQKKLHFYLMMAKYQAAWYLINTCVVEQTGWYEEGTCGFVSLQLLAASSSSA